MLVDLDVPHVDAVAAAVRHHIAHLPAVLGRPEWQTVAGAAAVHADDGVGDGHSTRVGSGVAVMPAALSQLHCRRRRLGRHLSADVGYQLVSLGQVPDPNHHPVALFDREVRRPTSCVGLEDRGWNADALEVLLDGDGFGDKRDSGQLDDVIDVTIGQSCIAIVALRPS